MCYFGYLLFLNVILLFLSGNQSTSFYVGVTDMMSEPTILVRYLLSNLTGSTVNVTQENCKNQREDKDDQESKHVRFTAAECSF